MSGNGQGELRTIVLAHDGSAGAARALDWTRALARQVGARVVVVHGYSPLEDLGLQEPPVDFVRLREAAEARLREEWAADLLADGSEHEIRLVEDLPIPAITRVADDLDADLVVCGTRGLGGMKGLLLGHVAAELPRRSHRPVAIIPPAA